jgi:hypothetical protein
MTKPSSKPEWATDGAALLADPGVPKRHAGFLVDEAPPAHWFNWLFKNIGDWIDFFDLRGANDELTYAAPRSHTRVFSPQGGMAGREDADHSFGAGMTGSVAMYQTQAATSGISWTKQLHLPEGSVITGWRSMVVVDVNNAASSPEISVQLRKCTPDWDGPSSGAPGFPIGSTSLKHIGSNSMTVRGQAGLSEVVLPGTKYFLEWSSVLINVALTHVIEAYELTWTETRATGNF